MDRKKEEFLARLRETFRIEASEHLEAITAGLLAIERAGAAERPPMIERIFREAHSLKGAARSVNLAGAEALCLELESMFAAMQREQLSLSTEMLDAIHPALGFLGVLCASPGASPSPEGRKEEEQALRALKRIVEGAAGRPAGTPEAAVMSQPRVAGAGSSGRGCAAGCARAADRCGHGGAGYGPRLHAET
jgi:two-component system chemotaxis sensor kinase CheA